MIGSFPGKVGLIQRVLPNYRAPFFNALGRVCDGGLFVYAGRPRTDEFIKTIDYLDDAKLTLGSNLHILSGQLYLCFQTGLSSWISEVKPDVLIVEANPRYLSTRAAIRKMHQKQCPVIGWGLGAPPISGALAPLRNFSRKQFIHQFEAMVTYSQRGAEEYAALGLPSEKIFVAINAVTPAPTEPIPSRPDPDQTESAQLLFVGRLQARKNIDNLIRACANLPEGLQPNMVIVGEGPARADLEDLAGQIYPKTTFTGALYGESLAEKFKMADLFVLPGTGGLAIQQAMRYGLPIIAAQADGTQEDLVRPANGWIIPPDDIPALEATLAEALADIQNLRIKGTESYRIVTEETNLEQMVATFLEALHRTVQ